MTRTWNRAHLVGLLAVTAIGGCKTNVGELGRFLACDDDGQCVDGYRCAQLDIGPTCLDEAEWMQRCGAGEICNGRDDDCDEATDEDFPTLGADCPVGIGACTVIGAFQCSEDGEGVDCDAVAGNPGAEVCDDIDNNCDGATDEIFTELGDDCTVGIGACLASGERVCREDGRGTACDVEPADPVAETCNGDDDDCNGVIDDGLPDCCVPGTTRVCGNDLGECTVGMQTCTPERAWGACSGRGPVADACNGLDDDCDGEADEGLADCCGVPGTTIPCSVDRGACIAGIQTCGGDGTWNVCSGVLPTPDRCDGDDNDCDGETDEDFADLGDDCSVDQGACEAFGVRVCTEDGLGTTCGAIAGTPTSEDCNLVDDDCDGEVDDGLVTYTGTDVGECQQGIERCINGAWTTVQQRIDPVAETCDGLDQDCDGIVDDEAPSCCAPGSVRTCGLSVGLCTIGSQTCGDDFRWSDCSGVGPTPERCDGLDNNCSGVADDPWALLLGSACTVGRGICVRSGIWVCNPDFSPSEGEQEGVVCDAVPGDPGTESCNGVDDDCDGSVDEIADLPPVFIGSDVGDCEPAVIACVGGTTTEVDPGQGPSPETCDGRDNDCSGTPDNDIPSVSCYTGPVGTEGVGICAGGDTDCVDSTLLCIGQSLPVAETCDGFDNNCDGVVDGSPGPGGAPVALAQPCYNGPPGTLGNGPCVAGTTTCSDVVWGDCVGEVTPIAEVCGDVADSDCDSRPDGITFLEDFEDNCAMPEATITTDVPFECVETPVDSDDPSRTPEGQRSLRASLAQVDVNIQSVIEWRFSTCAPAARGGVRLFLQTLSPNTGVFIQPEFVGQTPAFLVQEWDRRYVQVVHADGSFTDYVQPSTIPLGEWHDVTWAFDASGRLSFALDGISFFDESITATVDGIYLRCGLAAPGATIDLLFDDVRFSNP